MAKPLLALLPAPKLPFTPKYYSVPISISLDELNAVTLREILPGVVDNYFKASPLLAYMKERPPYKNSPRWVD